MRARPPSGRPVEWQAALIAQLAANLARAESNQAPGARKVGPHRPMRQAGRGARAPRAQSGRAKRASERGQYVAPANLDAHKVTSGLLAAPLVADGSGPRRFAFNRPNLFVSCA